MNNAALIRQGLWHRWLAAVLAGDTPKAEVLKGWYLATVSR